MPSTKLQQLKQEQLDVTRQATSEWQLNTSYVSFLCGASHHRHHTPLIGQNIFYILSNIQTRASYLAKHALAFHGKRQKLSPLPIVQSNRQLQYN